MVKGLIRYRQTVEISLTISPPPASPIPARSAMEAKIRVRLEQLQGILLRKMKVWIQF